VAVAFKDARFEGEVMHCEPKDSLYQTNIRFKDADEKGLRRVPRFPVRLSALVFAVNSSDAIPAAIIDISGGGLGLELSSALSGGDPVVVESVSRAE